jgi:hypothetical protein
MDQAMQIRTNRWKYFHGILSYVSASTNRDTEVNSSVFVSLSKGNLDEDGSMEFNRRRLRNRPI